ncbi:MAG: ABC transporter permease [Desulfovibrionaceae bacterium]|nr:ABC transporter permease [Desulfovibrionaceae bacterium]
MKRFWFLVRLAESSAWNRRGTLTLVVLSVILSTMLLLGIEKVRTQIKENFVQAVSGTDLVIGPKGGDLNLMLLAIFHLGEPSTNISAKSLEMIKNDSKVAWVVPISLGDSYEGFPVVATSEAFYEHYRYRLREKLSFSKGELPKDLFEVALGAEVAESLGLKTGDLLTLTHGMGKGHHHHHHHEEHVEHQEFPFKVAGILSPTGTPVDRSIYAKLEALEAIHIPFRSGVSLPQVKFGPEQLANFDLTPRHYTAALVGLKQKTTLLRFKREIDNFKDEPLLGVIPAVAMDKIWDLIGSGERVLLLISSLVTITGLASLAAVILAGLGERRRELAILRSVGARPLDILTLLLSEGLLLVGCGVFFGLIILYALMALLAPILVNKYGLFLNLGFPTLEEWIIIGGILTAGVLTSLIPAVRAYRLSLSDGLNVTV